MRTLLLLRREWREKTTRERLVKKSLKKEMPIAPTAGWRCAVQYDYAQSLTKAVEKLSIKEKEKRDIADVLLLLARFTAHRPTARSCSASVFSTKKKNAFRCRLLFHSQSTTLFFPRYSTTKQIEKRRRTSKFVYSSFFHFRWQSIRSQPDIRWIQLLLITCPTINKCAAVAVSWGHHAYAECSREWILSTWMMIMRWKTLHSHARDVRRRQMKKIETGDERLLGGNVRRVERLSSYCMYNYSHNRFYCHMLLIATVALQWQHARTHSRTHEAGSCCLLLHFPWEKFLYSRLSSSASSSSLIAMVLTKFLHFSTNSSCCTTLACAPCTLLLLY